MASTKPLVTIIISNLNGMQLNLLEECLDSLLKPGYPNWELIVVDNNSTDKSIDYLEKRFKDIPNARVIKNPINMYSQGLNWGAICAKGEYLAYFNNDVAIKKGYFQELIKQFEKDKKLAIAQAKLVNLFDRKKIDSAGETMDKYGNPITIGAGEQDKKQFDEEEEILSASGSACMIRKSTFEKLGMYDPAYGIGYEDMDLALRARRLGYKVKRFPKAVCYHKRASTDLAEFIRVKVKWHFNKNRISTMIKNYPLEMLLITLPFTILLYVGIGLYEWVVRQNWAIGKVRFTSMFWVLVNLPKLIAKRDRIDELGSKPLSNKDLSLFSDKSLVDLFKDFAK